MTAATMQLPTPPPSAPASKDQSVRKRRRRTAAGGATDDCFTCSRRSVKCDRRRPYCSQCLEIGNECSGYKTQLTWGVGVASRGKLRGLSLPIAKAPPVASVSKKSPSARAGAGLASTSGTAWIDTDEPCRTAVPADVDLSPEAHTSSTRTTSFPPHSAYDVLAMSQPEPTRPIPVTADDWNGLPYPNSVPTEGPSHRKLGAHLGPIAIPDSLSSPVSDVDYLSPVSHSYPRNDIPFLHSPNVLYDTFSSNGSPIAQSPGSTILLDQRAPTSCPSLIYAASEQSSSLHSHMDNFETHISQKMEADCDSLSETRTPPPSFLFLFLVLLFFLFPFFVCLFACFFPSAIKLRTC